MTLNTPALHNITVFDADYPHTFTFQYSGDQVVQNRIIIRENTTFHVVYDKVQDGLRLNHTIPANTLANNHIYTVQAQVFDADRHSSNLSETVSFRCSPTPQFYFTNINDGDVLSSANLTCSLGFSQTAGDAIKEYKYYLYDSNKSMLSASKSCYSIEPDNYTYFGLENITTYYLRAIGTTVFGFSVDTGYIRIQVKYNSIPTNIAVRSLNKDGKIIIDVNIVSTDYDLENGSYLLENGELTLINNKIVYHVKDIEDFSFVLKARNIPLGTFAAILCSSGCLKLSIQHISEQYYFKLLVNNSLSNYVLYKGIEGKVIGSADGGAIVDKENHALQTISTDYDQTSLIVFEVHRKKNQYSIKAYYQ